MSGQPTALAGAKAAAVRSLQIMADEDLTDFEAVIHPQAASREADGPPASRGRGPAAFHATALWLRGAFAELRWEIHEVAAESDIVAIHSTEASSASDCVALQGRPVKGAAVWRFDAGRVRQVNGVTSISPVTCVPR